MQVVKIADIVYKYSTPALDKFPAAAAQFLANKKRKLFFGRRIFNSPARGASVPTLPEIEVGMSSLLVCTQPATSLAEAFLPHDGPSLVLKQLTAVPHLSRVTPASRLEVRPAPETVSSGMAEIDALTGGLPRGCLTEIYGPASSGRTSLLLAAIAAATRRQEACALVDGSDAFDPQSAAVAKVDFKSLLWVRCNPGSKKNPSWKHGDTEKFSSAQANRSPRAWGPCLEQTLQTTDLLLQSGGFGLIAIDLGDIPLEAARRIPLTSWFRFRRTVENTPTVLLVVGQVPCARTCASLLLRMEGQLSAIHSLQSVRKNPEHAQLLQGFSLQVELVRSRLEHKPAQSDRAVLETRTAWTG
jgi:RecA DNA recombination protein